MSCFSMIFHRIVSEKNSLNLSFELNGSKKKAKSKREILNKVKSDKCVNDFYLSLHDRIKI